MTNTSERVSANIRAEMARKRVTAAQLAVELSLPPGSVSERMKGRIAWRIDELTTVARFLGVDLQVLLDGATDETTTAAS